MSMCAIYLLQSVVASGNCFTAVLTWEWALRIHELLINNHCLCLHSYRNVTVMLN